MTFLTTGAINKDIKKGKKKFAGNHFHDILRVFFENSPFITSETKRGYY